ncbi:hypothetical protein C8R43DRAFT_1125752 [Mycena crocata]|nr:hypothetical protein C8R43DRAFT_1125752 [Mycena crocata]
MSNECGKTNGVNNKTLSAGSDSSSVDEDLPDLISAHDLEDSDDVSALDLEDSDDEGPPPLEPPYDSNDLPDFGYDAGFDQHVTEKKELARAHFLRLVQSARHFNDLKRTSGITHISYDVACTFEARPCCRACGDLGPAYFVGMTNGEGVEREWASINPHGYYHQ